MLSDFFNRGVRLLLAAAILAIASTNYATTHAKETPPPMFEDVTIGPKFSPDPFIVRGMSGGPLPANKVVNRKETPTGPCTGFVDSKPDHILKLKSKFNYLKVVVESPEDTTLIISGPGGIWCNDDFDGKNPGILGEWLPGTYQIWVGSYQKNKSFPYTLKITTAK
jgi:hypothetical protein